MLLRSKYSFVSADYESLFVRRYDKISIRFVFTPYRLDPFGCHGNFFVVALMCSLPFLSFTVPCRMCSWWVYRSGCRPMRRRMSSFCNTKQVRCFDLDRFVYLRLNHFLFLPIDRKHFTCLYHHYRYRRFIFHVYSKGFLYNYESDWQ